MVSKETHKLLEEHSNMYYFERTEADMKGIGKEWVYQIKKRSNPQITSYQQVQAQRQKE